MKISAAGLDLIKAQEGYLTKQKDGGCKAYLCPAGVWTCGWGCTVGVTPNTVWTQAEATSALASEMTVHEANVLRLVKVPLNQGQFDALVSLCYNIGAGNLGKSTLMKHLNAGDYARAASHFADFKKAKVQGDDAKRMGVKPGTLVTLPGLVKRRAKEADLFLAETSAAMVQKVEPEQTKMKPAEAVAKVGAPIAVGVEAVRQTAPPDLTAVTAWKGFGDSIGQLITWGTSNPGTLAICVVVFVGVTFGLPMLRRS